MKIFKLTITLAFVVFASINADFVRAETVYVDDNKNLVWIRTGPTKEYRVLSPIPPHTKLEVLQISDETGFTQVKDMTGREFWIENQFLTRNETSKYQLATALRKIKTLEDQHAAKVGELEKQIGELSPMRQINEDLQGKMAQLESELEQTRQKAEMYSGRFQTEAFFTGSIVVLIGMVLGWVLTRLSGNRRNSGGWS